MIVVAGRRDMRTYRTICGAIAAVVCPCLSLSACAGQPGHRTGDTTCDGTIEGTHGTPPAYITAWSHTGQPGERQTLGRQVAAFNAAQWKVQVKLIDIPEAGYADQVRAAAAAGDLPDLLDLDGPNLYNYAWSGQLKPLGSCVSRSLRADLLPSIVEQGTYAGRLWGIGTFDSGLGLYIRPSILHRVGARIPRGIADAWTASEFTQILHRLQRAGYRQPLDLQVESSTLATAPEWLTYGFAPVVWSAGGDLIDRSTYRTAQGVLNSPASIQALTIVQGWFRDGLINPDVDHSFLRGHAPVSWVGHWKYDPYHAAFPRDLKIVPLPRFGAQPSSGMGSWQWGITSAATDGDAVWRFLSYLLQPAQVVQMTRANGAIPATLSAIRLSPDFAPGGPEHLYVQQLRDGIARPRPQTPAYPAITAAFAAAFAGISQGRDVRQALDAAVREIDGNLAANRNYQAPEP
jgi:multiple sugar transport system substrate-binding protein